MRRLLFLFGLLLQAGGQPVNIPIRNPVELGNGQNTSQDLGVTPEQLQEIPTHPNYYYEGVYQLTFSVANYFTNYPGYYTIELSFGTQELCETSGWGTMVYTQVKLVCPGPNYIVIDKSLPTAGPVQGKLDLVATWTVSGWPVLFKDVSLTFTPTN